MNHILGNLVAQTLEVKQCDLCNVTKVLVIVCFSPRIKIFSENNMLNLPFLTVSLS